MLVLCSANVCRSVHAAHLMREVLAERRVEVTSAGLRAHDELPPCREVRRRTEARGAPPLPRRPARQVATADVESASLVLTMTSAQRAAVVRSDPSVRPRAFTLLEAAALVGATGPAADLDEWVGALELARCRVPLPPPPRSFALPWFGARQRTASPLDISDGHTSARRGAHAATLDAVEGASLAVAEALASALTAYRPPTEAR